MSYIGKNPAVRSITCIGFANFAAADASTKRAGRLVYVIDEANFYKDTGTALEQLGSGGLDKWVTGEDYDIDAVIWNPSDYQIYVCNTAHTSSPAFATDAANWDILSFTDTKLLNQMLSTGVVDVPVLSAGTVGTFSVSAGKAVFVDTTTDPDNPTSTEVDITAKTNVAITNIATQPVTYVMATSSDTILQLSSFPTPEQRRDNAFLGVVVHSDNVNVNAINNIPDFVLSPMAQVIDLMRGLGTFNLSGNQISANGANLQINKSGGSIFKAGVNAGTNPKNPNSLVLGPQVAATFRYRLQDGTEGSDVTAIDPTIWDNAGSFDTVANNNNSTIQRVYIFPSGAIRIQPGQEVFTTLAQAVDSVGKESFNTEANIDENGLLLASIVIKKVATNLQDDTQAQIFVATRFGELGSVGSKAAAIFQDIYENSPVPQITLDAIIGTFRIADNATPIGNNLMEITNNNGANKYLEVSSDRTAVKDRDERHVLRKESNATYIEDFKENNPTDIITGLGSWTVSNATIASEKLRGYQSAKLTQVAGSLGATREIVGIPLTNEEIGSEMGLVFPFRYGGDANDLKVEILQSDDGVTYDVVGEINGALTLPRSLETSYAKLNGQFRTDAVFKGFRFTVLTENIGAELIFDNVRFITNPMPTAEFVQTFDYILNNSVSAGAGSYVNLSGGIGNLLDAFDIVGNQFVAKQRVALDASANLSLLANGVCEFRRTSGGSETRCGVTGQMGIDGRSTATTHIVLNAGDSFGLYANTALTTRDIAFTVKATRNSTNVIFKGANASRTIEKALTSPITTNTVISEWTCEVEIGKNYNVKSIASGIIASGDGTAEITISDGVQSKVIRRGNSGGSASSASWDYSWDFTAKGSTLTFTTSSFSAGTQIDSGQTIQLTPTEPPILAVPRPRAANGGVFLYDLVTDTLLDWQGIKPDSFLKSATGRFSFNYSSQNLIGAPMVMPKVYNNEYDVEARVVPSNSTNISTEINVRVDSSATFVDRVVLVEWYFGKDDYEAPSSMLGSNTPLSNGQSNGTEYWTGRMLDGRKVMARTWKTTVNHSSTVTIDTIPTGLEPVGIISGSPNIWYIDQLAFDGTNITYVRYNDATGVVDLFFATGNPSINSGYIFTLEYLQ